MSPFKNSLIVLFFILSWVSLAAQYPGAPNALGFRYTFTNYNYPITNENLGDGNFYRGGVEFNYSRCLNRAFNLVVPLRFGGADIPVTKTSFEDRNAVASLDALLQLQFFKEPNRLVPYLYGGIGGNWIFDQSEFNLQVPAGAGIHLRIAPHFYLNLQTEYRFGLDDLRDNLVHGVGFQFILGAPEKRVVPLEIEPEDRDKDGVLDADDACPDTPGLALLKGCPDQDGDGIADQDDACPTESGVAALRGCPDQDGDGIADADDRCPNAAGLASLEGCPDSDGDGVANPDDKCPNLPGPPALGGCPDSDRDGLADIEDRCPNTPGPPRNEGCPELKEEEKKVLAFATQAVEFETAKAILLPESKLVLNQVADILVKYPDYKIRIGGHTDSIGEADANQVLSEKRAKSCYEYLITRGIKADRISYQGFGESMPIADNRYKDGRQKNRRVEFDIYHD